MDKHIVDLDDYIDVYIEYSEVQTILYATQ